MKSTPTAAALRNMFDALDVFRSRGIDPPLNLLAVFLVIAQRKSIRAAQIAAETGISQSSISRNIIALGRGQGGKGGLGLVLQELDPIEPRAHSIRLTAKGRALAERLARCGTAPQHGLEGPQASVSSRDEETFQHVHWQNWVD